MDKYEVIAQIGKGSFGRVSKVRRKADGRILVWKETNYGRMNDKEKQMLVSEVNILRELRHPNITRYYDRLIDKEQAILYIVMEFCAGGDLSQQIRKHKQMLAAKDKDSHFSEERVWRVLSEITQALLECHRRKDGTKILHRDLKPGNVFFDAEGSVKLGDFGLSRLMGDESVFAYSQVGTPYYMSPECISEQRYNDKSDIWSVGCVLYEMAALRAPFEASNQVQLAEKIRVGKFNRIPKCYSDELHKVISKMLSVDQNSRPSVEQLMMHPRICYYIKATEVQRREKDIKTKEKEIKQLQQAIAMKQQAIQDKLKSIENRKQSKLYTIITSSPKTSKDRPASRQSTERTRDEQLVRKPSESLLSGIEAQRQKLQELKRGLTRKPSATYISPSRGNQNTSPNVGAVIRSSRQNSGSRHRDNSTERKLLPPSLPSAQTLYSRLRSASREKQLEMQQRPQSHKSDLSSIEQRLKAGTKPKPVAVQHKSPISRPQTSVPRPSSSNRDRSSGDPSRQKQKELRVALDEITKRIQSKYLY